MKKVYDAPEAEVIVFDGAFANVMYASGEAKSVTFFDDDDSND